MKLLPYIEQILANIAEIKNICNTSLENEFVEHFAAHYSDNIYEYLSILKGNSSEKKVLIDYIASKKSESDTVKTFVNKRARARTLRYETDCEILLKYLKENEYIYNLEIAQNIFASEEILTELTKLKGIKYCREINKRARETLKKAQKTVHRKNEEFL